MVVYVYNKGIRLQTANKNQDPKIPISVLTNSILFGSSWIRHSVQQLHTVRLVVGTSLRTAETMRILALYLVVRGTKTLDWRRYGAIALM